MLLIWSVVDWPILLAKERIRRNRTCMRLAVNVSMCETIWVAFLAYGMAQAFTIIGMKQ